MMTANEIQRIIEKNLNKRVDIDCIRYDEKEQLYEVDYNSYGRSHIATITDNGYFDTDEGRETYVWRFSVGPILFRKESFDGRNWDAYDSLAISKNVFLKLNNYLNSLTDITTIPGIVKNVDRKYKDKVISITCKGVDRDLQIDKSKFFVNMIWEVIVNVDSKCTDDVENYIIDYLEDCLKNYNQVKFIDKKAERQYFGEPRGKDVSIYFTPISQRCEIKKVL